MDGYAGQRRYSGQLTGRDNGGRNYGIKDDSRGERLDSGIAAASRSPSQVCLGSSTEITACVPDRCRSYALACAGMSDRLIDWHLRIDNQ